MTRLPLQVPLGAPGDGAVSGTGFVRPAAYLWAGDPAESPRLADNRLHRERDAPAAGATHPLS